MKEMGPRNPSRGLSTLGLATLAARYNAQEVELLETSLSRGEGRLSRDGALVVETGKFTGRSPRDKHIVREASSEADVWWEGNNAMEADRFGQLKDDIFAYLGGRQVEVQDLECGADPENAVNVRLVAEYAWHALFLRHLLRRPSREALERYAPDFTIVNTPGFRADPTRHGCRSDTVIAISFDQKLILVAGTEYAGENKKAAFTILNHIYPERGILPMHCSANHAPREPASTAIFFGLPERGKRRCRPIRAARSSAMTSTDGRTPASSISKAAATPRPSGCRGRPSPRSGTPPTVSARCSRTWSWTPRHGRSASTTRR